ncbi:hypothetical protein, partial [Mucilaginibacter sp. SG564]|uniref:hypothetical protein n=1 Tax=Mucilaginibacter sp. SG564 TaxID=2587022 RepID=UPI001556C778
RRSKLRIKKRKKSFGNKKKVSTFALPKRRKEKAETLSGKEGKAKANLAAKQKMGKRKLTRVKKRSQSDSGGQKNESLITTQEVRRYTKRI